LLFDPFSHFVETLMKSNFTTDDIYIACVIFKKQAIIFLLVSNFVIEQFSFISIRIFN
jgi:hypothetical protein